MARDLANAVVVITGASSGIGRAAALSFARRRATVVVAARRTEALGELVAECEDLGSRALAVTADVASFEDVRHIASRAVEAFGRIDVWVNNAGVGILGSFEETPPEVFQRVLDVNLLGYVHGTRAALPVFRRQASGILINNISLFAEATWPGGNAYITSKRAVEGFNDALRLELRLQKHIHVCKILPAGVDTPMIDHAANCVGKQIPAIFPLLDPWKVAHAIVCCATRPRSALVLGKTGRLQMWVHKKAPLPFEYLITKSKALVEQVADPAPRSTGNLFAPLGEGSRVGGERTARRATVRRRAFAAVAVATAAAWACRRAGAALLDEPARD